MASMICQPPGARVTVNVGGKRAGLPSGCYGKSARHPERRRRSTARPSTPDGSVSFRAVEFDKFRPSTPGLKLLPGQRGQSRFSACAANAAQWQEHVPAFGIGIAESFAVRHSRGSSVSLIQCSSVQASVDIDS